MFGSIDDRATCWWAGSHPFTEFIVCAAATASSWRSFTIVVVMRRPPWVIWSSKNAPEFTSSCLMCAIK